MNNGLKQPGYCAYLPADVRLNKKLSPEEKLVYAEITALAYYNGFCYAGDKYIADLYGWSERVVRKYLLHLEQLGYIERYYMGRKRYIRVAHYKGNKAPNINKQLPSYEEILIDFGVEDTVKPAYREFLKHCTLNKKTVTNDKLQSMIIELDLRFGKDDIAKAEEIYNIINCGWFGLKKQTE